MLTKTLSIRNVGRFDFSNAVELAQATLVYAENGRGKTTLAAILRSLQTGEPLHILERKTIGSVDGPSVGFLASVGAKKSQLTFDGQVWSTTLQDCEIFDSAFIAENVYSGSEIDSDHRRRLHKFVLGSSNVALAKSVDDLDDQIRGAAQLISEAELLVQSECLDQFRPEEFIKLPESATVESEIAEQQRVVEAARAAKTIAATQTFESLGVPTFAHASWDDALALSLRDLSSDAQASVRRHLAEHLGGEGEAWLAEGLGLVRSEICPFCAADLTGNALVEAFRGFFTHSYKALKRAVSEASEAVDDALGDLVLAPLRQRLQANSLLSPFWEAHGVACPAEPSLSEADDALTRLSKAYSSAFAAKLENPLEPIAVEADAEWECITRLVTAIEQYNAHAAKANAAIRQVKEKAAANRLPDALAGLQLLRNQRARWQPTGSAAVTGLINARAAKRILEAQKKQAKEALDKATDALFQEYQDRINKHLANCGCGYAITGTKTMYAGGKPRTEYQLVINNQAVELNAQKTIGKPSFKNTLSDGDKSTLAFAFFSAKLELDTRLGDKIVVLDDPMTSLDAHRRNYTASQIVGFAGRCRQLILLTHDALFARQVWDALPKPKKALCIADVSNKSALVEWDVVAATQADYFVRYKRILDFVTAGAGDPGYVAASLRLLLEANLRMRFPTEFPAGEWLGDFIRRVSGANHGTTLGAMKATLAELTALNDYAKQFHHDQNPTAVNVKPVEAELKAFAKRTFAYAAGLP